MQRVSEDVSEKLDIIPAQFFVHRHIYGKWACRCCQQLVQEPAEPDVVDRGIPASGLVAHTQSASMRVTALANAISGLKFRAVSAYSRLPK
jgi:transposase